MPRRWVLLPGFSLILALLSPGCGERPEPATPAPAEPPPARVWLETDHESGPMGLGAPRTGDLPEIRKQGFLRVLVSYNQTNYFVSDGRQRGLEFEQLSAFERFLAREARGQPPLRVIFLTLPFDQLLPALVAGFGDVAAAGLTITSERTRVVSFSNAYRRDVAEVVVRHSGADPVTTLEGLSGRTIHVGRGTSYATHLRALADRLGGRPGHRLHVVEADPVLETEDLLQMVNAGIYSYTVADDHLARLWTAVLPELVIENEVRVAEGGELAWAVRPENLELRGALNRFVAREGQGTLLGNDRFRRYHASARRLGNPASPEEWRRLHPFASTFKRVAAEHGFDWLRLVALAYQESRLDPTVRSPAGAIGLMQVRPATAADVGVAGIERDPLANIEAGTRYLAFLRDRYFSNDEIAMDDRMDFTLAAYNAGPARVARLRRQALGEGLDPNRWFGNVEHVALREIGRETFEYVGNVHKYHLAYRTVVEQEARRTAADRL
ncbi:MAG: transporter substrate-binding domain-containing protein [Myxococcota bacterium]